MALPSDAVALHVFANWFEGHLALSEEDIEQIEHGAQLAWRAAIVFLRNRPPTPRSPENGKAES